MTQETFTFQAEVSRLLDIVAHSLYSEREIFLRELISNAADACDKLRYEAQSNADLAPKGGFKIALSADATNKTLTVSDNGIGMNRDDLIETLGTIARSGTLAFAEQLADDAKKDANLIGQFGVGFYSAFMVADEVTVITRKAGEDQAWVWVSDGRGGFSIDTATRDEHGTTVILSMKKDAEEFLEAPRIEHVVKTYSDHVSVPIVLADGDEPRELNEASALWSRAKKDITDEQYKEFYHHVGHGFDDPWAVIHNHVEGVLSYTNLLFIPTQPPFDLFHADRKRHVKLYVNRVFITDDCEGLVPGYLRFLRGVVDSEDLSLNVSRELLQNDPKLAKIRAGLVKRVLGELKKKADKAPDDYAAFWENFGAVLKEGLYEDETHREKLLEVARMRSTAGDALTGLDGYLERMKDGQDAIYYITGENANAVAASPQLEGFKAKGIEVLLMSDPVDAFWLPAVGQYKDMPFRSVTQGAADLDKVEGGADEKDKQDEAEPPAGLDALIAAFKLALEGEVGDVRASKRLTDSAVCLVAGEGGLDMHLEQILKQHNQAGAFAAQRVLEINPDHALIKGLAEKAATDATDGDVAEAAKLLLDQARILEGEPVADAPAFAKRLAAVMAKAF
jgi:molecular chaperone HtpG